MRSWPHRRIAVALTACVLLTSTAACDDDERNGPAEDSTTAIQFYGTDSNMLNVIGEKLSEFPNELAGMKGTAPLAPLPDKFVRRVTQSDPKVKDPLYSGEAYDAVVIASLAAATAGTTEPRAIAAQIPGVTTTGITCHTPDSCLRLIDKGLDIAYRGVSLRLSGLTSTGEPSTASYGVLRFIRGNQIDPLQTEYVPVGSAEDENHLAPPTAPRKTGTGPLRLGGLMPHTGSLSVIGPPMFAGAMLGIADVNRAGGVLGRPVQWFDGDDHTDKAKAVETAKRLIAKKVHVIIGAGASSVTAAVLPVAVAAGVVLFSPSNTASFLSDADDQGLYFRTTPPDRLQAGAITDLVMRDGVRRLAIVARDDAYGRGLHDSVKEELLKAGLREADIRSTIYSSDKPDFHTLGSDVVGFAPDGVLLIGFDESADALISLMRAGLRPLAG